MTKPLGRTLGIYPRPELLAPPSHASSSVVENVCGPPVRWCVAPNTVIQLTTTLQARVTSFARRMGVPLLPHRGRFQNNMKSAD